MTHPSQVRREPSHSAIVTLAWNLCIFSLSETSSVIDLEIRRAHHAYSIFSLHHKRTIVIISDYQVISDHQVSVPRIP